STALARPICSPGGSSRKVYSRANLPEAQFNSTRRSTKGSLIGRDDEIRTTARPSDRRSIRKFNPLSAGLYSSPAWRKASGGARLAASEADSSGERDVISTSACRGWPSADWTVSRPRPAASAYRGRNNPPETAKATATPRAAGVGTSRGWLILI